MESDLKSTPKSGPSADQSIVAENDSSEKRISELSTALNVVKTQFADYRKKLRVQIVAWGLFCFIIVLFSGILAVSLLRETFPDNWTWQIFYVSIIRISIAAALYSVASFCFKIFRYYININEHNTHCIKVIGSMANIVGASQDEDQRNLIYHKLIDLIIGFSHYGSPIHPDNAHPVSKLIVDSVGKAVDQAIK